MRAVKLALAQAFRDDAAVAALVPGAQIFATERATIPALPAIELIGVSSERVGDGPMAKHELSIELTCSHSTEDGADEALSGIVRAVRRRLGDAEAGVDPIGLPTREGVLVVLGGVRWSVSASGGSGVIRGASVSLAVEVSE